MTRHDPIRRARPLLGTLVEIRVHGVAPRAAARAIDAAFEEIARVQQCMSFHAVDSDVCRLNAAPAGEWLDLDLRTAEVLALVRAVAARSGGAFDVTVAPRAVASGLLPVPSARTPDADADWRDIELGAGARVRLNRPLWLDLGGIAKGYAVDRAIAVLLAHGVPQACVNAGGDLRAYGAAERVHLRAADGSIAAALELADAAVATSSSGASPTHWRGARGAAIAPGRSASVVAPQCALADALTKVALALAPEDAQAVLAAFGAQAALHDATRGWHALARAA
jgi:thiamine biosynthesis lipoprotein